MKAIKFTCLRIRNGLVRKFGHSNQIFTIRS